MTLMVSHNQSSSDSGGVTSESSQDRLTLQLTTNNSLSSRMTLKSDLSLDLLTNESVGRKSMELQPKVRVGLSSSSVTFNTGYRTVTRDTSITTGTTSSEQHNESFDIFADTRIRVGKIPEIRLRYGNRGRLSDNDGTVISDSASDDMALSTNYKIFGVSLSADYQLVNSKDNITGFTTKSQRMSGQMGYAVSLGSKLKLRFRDSLNINKASSESEAGTAESERKVNNTEIKATIFPFKRAVVNLTYKTKTQTGDTNKTTDSTIVGSAAYSLPKYLRFNAVYSSRTLDKVDSVNKSETLVGKVLFKHAFKKISVIANYETRKQQVNVTKGGNSFSSENTRNKYDWTIGYKLSDTVRMILSESNVKTENLNSTIENDRIRFKLDIGPWHGITLTPYYDIISNKNSSGAENTKTDLVMLLTYHKSLGNKLDLSFSDNYRSSVSKRGGGQSAKSESNNASVRLTLPNVLNNMTMSLDASQSTSKTGGTSTSSSTYNYRLTWYRNPHNLSASLSYRTGSSGYDSYSGSLSYSLGLKWNTIAFSFSASYSYSQTLSTPASSGQNMFLTMTVRK